MPDQTYHRLLDLSGRVVVIVGAGQGMGLESARAAAEYGARVVCVDREQELADAAAAETGGVSWSGDVTDPDEVTRLRDAALDLGRLDAVIDVVGGSALQSPDALTLDAYRQMLTLNTDTVYILGRILGQALVESGGGSMVFWGSAISSFGARDMIGYGASKAAVASLVRTFAEEYGAAGVRVNAIAPASILTPRLEARWDEETTRKNGAASVLQRMGKPSEVAAAALFLVSDAASYITGHTLTIDGGASVRGPWAS